MTLGKIEISGGALLTAALLFYLDRGGVLGQVLLAGAVHELGHWGMIAALGGEVRALRISCVGAEMKLSSARPLTPAQTVLCALAGPLANLMLAGIGSFLAHRGVGEWLYLFAGLNLGLAALNLFPAQWLDGGRALTALFQQLGRPELGDVIGKGASVCAAAALLLAGGWLFWESEGRNFTALLVGAWLVTREGKGWLGCEKREKR